MTWLWSFNTTTTTTTPLIIAEIFLSSFFIRSSLFNVIYLNDYCQLHKIKENLRGNKNPVSFVAIADASMQCCCCAYRYYYYYYTTAAAAPLLYLKTKTNAHKNKLKFGAGCHFVYYQYNIDNDVK